eukprot:SAG11_NODE_1499_length_4787_cov_14.242747_2_plen_211_part_00
MLPSLLWPQFVPNNVTSSSSSSSSSAAAAARPTPQRGTTPTARRNREQNQPSSFIRHFEATGAEELGRHTVCAYGALAARPLPAAQRARPLPAHRWSVFVKLTGGCLGRRGAELDKGDREWLDGGPKDGTIGFGGLSAKNKCTEEQFGAPARPPSRRPAVPPPARRPAAPPPSRRPATRAQNRGAENPAQSSWSTGSRRSTPSTTSYRAY